MSKHVSLENAYLKRSAVDEGETPVTVPEAPTNATTITKPVTVT
jgi:hypothetical protein